MVRFERVAVEGLGVMDYAFPEGAVIKIELDSAREKQGWLDTLWGRRSPREGRVLWGEHDLYALPESLRLACFRQAGLVRSDGGLISNLKIWENIMLPACYHLRRTPEELEPRVLELLASLEHLGQEPGSLSDYLGRLPGPLPVPDKRLIGLARAMLMEPALMVYETLLEGLSRETAVRLARFTSEYHRGGAPTRVSVYVTTELSTLAPIRADLVVRQSGKEWHYETHPGNGPEVR